MIRRDYNHYGVHIMGNFAFIWDLDGTLLDSYPIIVPNLRKTLLEFGIDRDEEALHKELITYSLGVFLLKTEKETEISSETLKKRFSEINDRQAMDITPVRHAAEILEYLKNEGIHHYVYTHKGAFTEEVLKNIGLYDFFEEIVTGNDGFPKKPDPAAVNYLVRKHRLEKESSFYVGDRAIDILCADNAGIRSILYRPEGSFAVPTGKETYIVKDLLEIREIIRTERMAS